MDASKKTTATISDIIVHLIKNAILDNTFKHILENNTIYKTVQLKNTIGFLNTIFENYCCSFTTVIRKKESK